MKHVTLLIVLLLFAGCGGKSGDAPATSKEDSVVIKKAIVWKKKRPVSGTKYKIQFYCTYDSKELADKFGGNKGGGNQIDFDIKDRALFERMKDAGFYEITISNFTVIDAKQIEASRPD